MKVPIEKFLKRSLYLYIKCKNELGESVLMDTIYHEIIDRLDGRINKDLVYKILNDIAYWDWKKGYVIKKEVKIMKELTLDQWMKGRFEERIIFPDPPELLIPYLVENFVKEGYTVYMGKEYAIELPRFLMRKITKDIDRKLKSFPLVVIVNEEQKMCIDINRVSIASWILNQPSMKNIKIVILLGKPYSSSMS